MIILVHLLLLVIVPVPKTFQNEGLVIENCEDIDATNLRILEEVISLTTPGQPLNLAWSSDGSRLLVSGTFGLSLYSLKDDRYFEAFRSDGDVERPGTRIASNFSSDVLAMSIGEKTVRLWRLDSEDDYQEFSVGTTRVWSLAFSPNGETLAVGLSDGTILLRQIENPNTQLILKSEFGHSSDAGNPVWDLEFSSDGRWLAGAPLQLWDLLTMTEYQLPFELPLRDVDWAESAYDITFSNSYGLLAAVHQISKENGIWLFDIENKRKTNAPLTDAELRSVAFDPQGSLMAVGHESGFLDVVYLAGFQDGYLAWGPGWSDKAHDDTLDSLAFHPSGKLLASASSRDSTVALWGVCK